MKGKFKDLRIGINLNTSGNPFGVVLVSTSATVKEFIETIEKVFLLVPNEQELECSVKILKDSDGFPIHESQFGKQAEDFFGETKKAIVILKDNY